MWKKQISKYVLLLAGTLLGFSSISQETYNLQSLIGRVLEENYQVRIQKNTQLISENNNTFGNAGFLPTLDAEGNASLSYSNAELQFSSGDISEGTNAESKNLNTLVLLNWTVFDGFKMFAKKQQLNMLEELGAVNTRYFIEQTIADITLAYFEVVFQKELLENYRDMLEISRFRFELENKKIKVGSGNALLFNQALVDYNNDSLTVLETEMWIQTLEIRITRFANLDPEKPLSLEMVEMEPSLLQSRDSIVATAIRSNREIKQSMLEEMIAGKSADIQRAAYYPVVSLYGQYNFTKQSNEVSFVRQNNTYGPQFGLSVRFNLFNGGNDRRRIINEEINERNTSLNYNHIVSLIKAGTIEKHFHYSSLLQQLKLAGENLAAAQRSLDIATFQFESGAIDGYNFRQTQLSLIEANNRFRQIGFRLKSAEVEMNRLTGSLLNAYLR